MIGLLTETIGNPTPFDLALVPQRTAPHRRPAVPGRAPEVALQAVIEYSMTGTAPSSTSPPSIGGFPVPLPMGRNSIERGSRDPGPSAQAHRA